MLGSKAFLAGKSARMKGEVPQINYMFWIFQTLAMMVTGWLVPGLKIVNPIGAFLMVLALAFANAHLWDAALFFEIPDSLTARTFTLLAANGVIFWVLVKILPYIEIRGCLSAIAAPVIFTVLSIAIGYAGSEIDWEKTGQSAVKFIGEAKDHLLNQRSEKRSQLLLFFKP